MGRAAIAAVLLLIAPSIGAQHAPLFPQQTKHLPVKTYVNNLLGFELSYPVGYRRKHSSLPTFLARMAESERWQVLLYATTGTGQRRCEEENRCDNFGTLVVALDPRPFDLETIGKHYEHTGWVDAVPFQAGVNTFYYIGAGGGGVTYPDTFFYNLDGRILVIEFDGPYLSDSQSPSGVTKSIEQVVLEGFHLRSDPTTHK